MPDRKLWAELVDIARWAASPHNVQPWKVRVVDEYEADLLYDPERLLRVTDPTGRFTVLGFGYFIETLGIAARNRGFDILVDYVVDHLDYSAHGLQLFAKLRLAKVEHITEQFTDEQILARRTNRRKYNGKKIPDSVFDELKQTAKSFSNSFEYSEDPMVISFFQELNRDTLFYDLSDEATRQELAGWLRTRTNQAKLKKDGLWSKCFHFPGWLMRLFFYHHWIVNLPIIKQIIGKVYYDSTGGASAAGWIIGRFETFDEQIEAGRMLCRFWLVLAKHGVANHPYGSVVTNKQANQIMKRHIPVDQTKGDIWLLFRLGYAEEPPRSLRLRTDDILIKPSK